jgi:hypothetical protein
MSTRELQLGDRVQVVQELRERSLLRLGSVGQVDAIAEDHVIVMGVKIGFQEFHKTALLKETCKTCRAFVGDHVISYKSDLHSPMPTPTVHGMWCLWSGDIATVLDVNPDGDLLLANPAGEQSWRYEPSHRFVHVQALGEVEVLVATIYNISIDETLQIEISSLGGAVLKELFLQFDSSVHDLSRQIIAEVKPEWKGVCFFDENGKKVGLLALLRDHSNLACKTGGPAPAAAPQPVPPPDVAPAPGPEQAPAPAPEPAHRAVEARSDYLEEAQLLQALADSAAASIDGQVPSEAFALRLASGSASGSALQ